MGQMPNGSMGAPMGMMPNNGQMPPMNGGKPPKAPKPPKEKTEGTKTAKSKQRWFTKEEKDRSDRGYLRRCGIGIGRRRIFPVLYARETV